VAFQGAEADGPSLAESTTLHHGSNGAHLFLHGFTNSFFSVSGSINMDQKKAKVVLDGLVFVRC